jgi:hypothetical protein
MSARSRICGAKPYGVATADTATPGWAARISIGGKDKGLGIYATKEDAAHAYDNEARKHPGKPLNDLSDGPRVPERRPYEPMKPLPKIRGLKSRFRGVQWNSRRQRWRAVFGGKSRGDFREEKDAARAYNAAATARHGALAILNDLDSPDFCRDGLPVKPAGMKHKKRPNHHSKLFGVVWSIHKQKWRAQITLKGKLTIIGLYDAEIEAGRAYNEWAQKHHGRSANLNDLGDGTGGDSAPESKGGLKESTPEQIDMWKVA